MIPSSIDSRTYAPFVGCRTRFQRLHDAKTFHGWLREVDDAEVVLWLRKPERIFVGEEFHVEVSGPGEMLWFEAVLDGELPGGKVAFRVSGPFQRRGGLESSRKLVDKVTVSGYQGCKTISASLTDVSEHGLGFITRAPIEKGASLDLELTGGFGKVECSAVVKYCRYQRGEEESYRIGAVLSGKYDPEAWLNLLRYSG